MAEPKKVFLREATGLVRDISPFGAFAIGIIGVAISVSVYVNETLIPALFPRSNVGLLFIIALPIVFCWAMMYLQFNVAMPRSGADYVWVSRTLNPVLGFLQNFYTFFGQTTVIGVIAAVVVLMLVNAFEAAGLAFHSASIFNVSTTISTADNITIIGAILVLIFAAVTVSGIRNLQRVVIVLWAYSIIGIIGFIILLLSVSHTTFLSNFNSAFGTNETAVIIQAAEGKGWVSGWTVGGTFAALPFAIEAVLGFAWATYAGGEMKNIRRSSLGASVLPAIFATVLFIVFGYAVYQTFGYDFSSAIGYLFNNYPGTVAAGAGAASAPVALPFVYSVFMNSNPYLVTFIAFSFPIGQAAAILTSFLLVTRCLFAWSFDRVVPAKFGEVSERFHTPVYSVAFLTVVAIIVVALSNLTSFFGTYLLNTTDGYVFSAIIVSIAAIWFPYGKAKRVFEGAPSIVKTKIGGLPVLAIVGGVSLVAFVYTLYAGLTTPAIGGPISPYSFIFGLAIPFAFPVVVFYASRRYHRSRGIDIGMAFQEIPPE